jgi:diamine N-acetyltransferase
MRFLIDENMPRSLSLEITALGFAVEDVRDLGLQGLPDTEVFEAAIRLDAIIITRDRGFTFERAWPEDFTAGVVFVNLSDSTPTRIISEKIRSLLIQRVPASLVGAVTIVESQRALSKIVRRRKTTAVLIRYATFSDAEVLAELSATTFHQAFDGSSKQENVDDYIHTALNATQLALELRDPSVTFCLAELNQQVVGYLKLIEGEVPECVSDAGAIELSRLYVRQEFIANKIGAALMQKALDEARAKDYQTIFLGVWEHNTRAQAFYHKWGFNRVGEHIFQMGDDPQIDWWMERKL